MNTVQSEWDSFKEKVIPKDAPPVQLKEMRNAFYGGAWSMLNMLTELGNLSEKAAMGMIDGLEEEFKLFLAEKVGEIGAKHQ